MTDVDVIKSSMTAPDDGWVVIWTASRAEKKVESRIAALGVEVWLPTVTERRRWSDRWRELATPLFPGYLFARIAIANWHQLLRTPGVLTVVKDGDRPARLDAGFVASLRQAVEGAGVSAEAVSEPDEYARGDEVVVQEGVLAGVRGVVREQRSGRKLVIWVREVGRGVSLTIGSAAVSRCRDVRA